MSGMKLELEFLDFRFSFGRQDQTDSKHLDILFVAHCTSPCINRTFWITKQVKQEFPSSVVQVNQAQDQTFQETLSQLLKNITDPFHVVPPYSTMQS